MIDRKKGVVKEPSITFKLKGDTGKTIEKMVTVAGVKRHEVGQLALELGLQALAEYPGGINALLENRARARLLQEIFGSAVAKRLERIAKDQGLESIEVARIALGVGCEGLENGTKQMAREERLS